MTTRKKVRARVSAAAVALGLVGLLGGGCVADTGYVGTTLGASDGYYYNTPIPDPYFYDTPTYYQDYYVVPPPAYAPRVNPRWERARRERYEHERERRRHDNQNRGDARQHRDDNRRPSTGHQNAAPAVRPPATVRPGGQTPRPQLPGLPSQPRPSQPQRKSDPKHAPGTNPPDKQR